MGEQREANSPSGEIREGIRTLRKRMLRMRMWATDEVAKSRYPEATSQLARDVLSLTEAHNQILVEIAEFLDSWTASSVSWVSATEGALPLEDTVEALARAVGRAPSGSQGSELSR